MGKENNVGKLDIAENNEQKINNADLESGKEAHHGEHRHHYHHHHHHRSKHRGSRSGGKNKSNKFTSFIKQHKNVLINVLSCTLSIVLLILLATKTDNHTVPGITGDKSESTDIPITQSTVKIETSIYPDKISLISNAIAYYMDTSNNCTAIEAYKIFDDYTRNLNYSLPVNFVYRISGLPFGISVESAKLYLSESQTYQSSQIYLFDVKTQALDLHNLKTGTRYYYRLDLSLSDDCMIGTTGSFETDKSPRILNIDGAVNIRDIGGWTTTDGKTIRQGLLFRGCELDAAVEPKYLITDKGLQQMVSELGVRFDMDLRSSTDNKDNTNALGNNVVHKYYNAPMYSEILNDSGREVAKNIFSDLAKPENYPIYLHCTYGRDRTGTVCYLLEALLGLSDADLRKEYEISLFTDSYVNYAEFDTFTARIRSMDGATTKEKVENWLLSIGVTEEEIASIREIFLGE